MIETEGRGVAIGAWMRGVMGLDEIAPFHPHSPNNLQVVRTQTWGARQENVRFRGRVHMSL